MILIDTGEAQHVEANLKVSAEFVPWLEDETGADIVLSTWQAPAKTDALIHSHIERGEGIQLKRDTDLPASVKDRRLVNQINKMCEIWDMPLVLHHCTVTLNGREALFDGKTAKFHYAAYQSTIKTVCNLGAVFIPLLAEYSLYQWLQDELKRMEQFKPERLIRAPKIKLVSLTPQEETLATFPGIGAKRAHDIWHALPQHAAQQTLIQAFCWLTDGYAQEYVAGVGEKTAEAAKKHLGVPDEMRLTVERTNGYMKVNDVIAIKEE